MLLTHLFENKHMTEADIASVNWNTDSKQDNLNEFAPGAGGDDEAGDDPYKYPKPESYRRSVDYFGQFEADHFDREDFDDAPGEPIANMEATEKVGNMDADAFDAAMARLKKLAGAGPMKTVWDPAKRVYKNVPTAVQPKK